MALPGTILLPGAMLPLLIFELRYRRMLDDALSAGRIFAIAHEDDPESGCAVGSAGLIRACVTNPDGSSHLMLQGIGRIRFQEWLPGQPYRLARVQKMAPRPFDETQARQLQTEIRTLCAGLEKGRTEDFRRIDEQLDGRTSIEEFGDFAAAALVADLELRRRLLEDPDLTSRLTIILAYLKKLSG